MADKFPVLVFTGPRQSGKTTLSQLIFPEYRYVSLENPDNLEFAQNDPNGFLKIYDKYVIIDEAQNAPQLFSYIQQIVDESGVSGHYILSGSQNYLMLEKITQSLAGRVYLMELLPLCFSEIETVKKQDAYTSIIYGGYPRIYDKHINPSDFYPSYIQTYIERDVRTMLHVQDLSLFRKFIDLCAIHSGQIFNANSISKAIGVDLKTVQRWLSILETSYIAFTLKPWHKNFSKRIVKSPKLYFYDTGLLSYLLGIEDPEELLTSVYKGSLFENYALVEIMKNHKNKGLNRNYYFWRDSNGNEIDLIIERGLKIQCVEMKASATVKSEFLKSLHYLDGLDPTLQIKHYLINTQDESQQRTNETIVSWKNIEVITE
ncbi:MAG: ATP-binding protein [Flavobacteriia bacterium]|nr:ATP-binding protein [Flavobacteriia bacterium]